MQWLLTLGIIMFFSNWGNSQTYCGAGASTVEQITLVQIGGITNATANSGTSAYQNFTNVKGYVSPSCSYPITLKGNTSGNYTNYFTVFIDWNNNGTLIDPGEMYEIGSINNSSGIDTKVLNGTIAVPASVTPGNKRMRVFKNFNSSPTNPCATVSYGQIEDYTIQVGGIESATKSSTASLCNNATLNIGPGAYQDLVLASNTYYNFSWANGSINSGYTATIISGGSGATSVSFSGTETNWFSGTTAPTVRILSNRNCASWSSPSSAILTYRHSQPTTTTVSGGGTFCATAMPANLTASPGANGIMYWQNTSNNGVSTSTPSSAQNVSGPGTYYFRAGNNGCWGAQGSATVSVNPAATPPTAISGGGNFCHGNTTTLAATGGNSGTNGVIVWQEGACNTAYEQNWGEQPFGTGSTTVNSVNGILNVTSTSGDPMLHMNNLGSFDPTIYRYINIRYKVTAGAAGDAQIFWHNGLHSGANGAQVKSMPLISNNAWHITSIDMTNPALGPGDWLHSNVTGWRFDWATQNGVTMDIDFISLDEFPIIAEGSSYTPPALSQTKTFYASRRSECGATSCISSTVSLPSAGATLSQNGESATCIVNGTNIIHFYHSSGRLITSINPNGQNLGSVTATSYVNASSIAVPACADPTNPNYVTESMGRRWVIKPTIEPISAVTINLPFDNAEYVSLATNANANSNANDNLASIASLKLSKYSGKNENGAFADNCGNGVTTLHPQTTSGNVTAYLPAFGANGRYARYDISSFSEFWLHGSTSSPLPVTLTNFSATCEDNVTLSWTTASEKNSDRFIVEKSRDGQTWSNVGEQTAAGNSNTILDYNFTDANSWNATSYYRLRQIDFNGVEEVYGPISVSCENKESSMTVYPNPNSGSFTIEIESTEMYNNAQLFLTDLTGKVITSQTVNVASGTTQILINDLDLKMGTYLVTLRGADEQVKPVKVMVLE